MRVLVVENYSGCSIGLFAETLLGLGAELTMINVLENNNPVPVNAASEFDGLIVLGGAMGAYDDGDYPNIPKVIQLLRDFHLEEKPVLAICLGAQMLARALGEPFKSNDGLELGFVPLALQANVGGDALFSGLESQWSPIEWHADNFHIPSAATLLMSGEACRNQAFKAGKASYAFQFHPEIDEPGLRTMVAQLDASYLDEIGAGGREKLAQLLSDVPHNIESATRAGRQLVSNWYQILGSQTLI